MPGVSQSISCGGNAANTSLGLACLGMNVSLICRTDAFGLNLLRYFLGRNGVNLDRVKTDGKLAITAAMEFESNHANVMIGDQGSVSNFSFDILDEPDLDLIANSDLVGVTNWTLNSCGSKLACDVFNYASKNNTKTFLDTGDPSHRKQDIPILFNSVLTSRNLDIFGINDNELRHFNPEISISNDEDILRSALSLKKKINARLDVHTSNFSATLSDNHIVVPSLRIGKIYRSTGAGDAWNAGNIFAGLLNFKDDERLFLANTIAGLYISSEQALHPDIPRIIDFIKNI